MRALSIVPALLLATAMAAAQEKTVTFQSDGAPAKKVLAELSAKTRLHLQANPQTENETLFIQVKDAPIDKLLAKIAWAVGGSWRTEGDTQILQRTDSDRLELRRIERDREVANYQAGIDRSRQEAAKAGQFGSSDANKMASEMAAQIAAFDPENQNNSFYKNQAAMQKRAPAGRAFNRLLAQFTAQELAGLPTTLRTVYSNNPTRMQRPLSKAALGILADFQREQNLWIEAARQADLKQPTINGTTYGISGLPDLEGGPISKVVLTAIKMPMIRGVVMFEMIVADTKGRTVARMNGTIAPIDVENLSEKPKGNEATIELDPNVQATMNAALRMLSGTVDPAFVAKVVDPENNDPVALLASPILRGYGKARNANFVVNAPDFLTMLGNMGSQSKIPVSTVDSLCKVFCENSEEDGWVAWRPTDMEEAQKVRADRRVLAQYLKRMQQPNSLSFDERAYWAYRLPMDDNMSPMVLMLRRIVRSSSADSGGEMDYYDGRFLKLYGSMTSDQRRQARAGGFPMASFSQEQLAIVMELVYGMNSNLDYQPTEASMVYSDLSREPTEALPDGIPPKSFLTIEETTDQVAFVNYSWQGGGSNSQACSASELAWYKHSASRPDLYPWVTNQTYDFSKLRFGKRVQIMFKLNFSPAVSKTFQSQERQYSGKGGGIDSLPAEFLQEFQKHLKDYEESAKNQKPGQFGNDPVTHRPPPPL